MVAESLSIPKTAVLPILEEDLGKRMLCARFVPHSLTPEQRKDGFIYCQDIIAMADADKNFIKKIISGGETWCFAYDPETKRQFRMGWRDRPSAEETEVPKTPHQDNVDIFLTLKA